MRGFRAGAAGLAAALGAGLAPLSGCAEDPAGALDAEAVAALALEVGDARGFEPGGVFRMQVRGIECGCEDLDSAWRPLTLCGALLGTPVDGPTFTDAEAVVSDGRVVWTVRGLPNASLVGALDGDGTFATGAVTRLTSLATQGEITTRMDAAFRAMPDADVEVTGTLRHRVEVEIGVDGLEPVRVDCAELVAAEGRRDIVR